MCRTSLPYSAGDISALARSLRAQLAGRAEPPGHVEWLNMLAKAVGCRNFQHFRAQTAEQTAAQDRLGATAEAPPPADPVRVLKVARCFDAAGALLRWPPKRSERDLCLWVLWSRIAAGRMMSEGEVNDLLRDGHRFGDHVLLRRELCDFGLLDRTRDGSVYRRVERRPPPEALAMIRRLKPVPATGRALS
ncbi:DUF2087 domain-containing protein [Azospirillum formosense]|uniref:DUF2087 domain-containing protein n=1 Tax=Azospirillum formosense TaxID=861533 RepID=A0ABX2KYK3_9PROT|nr:DUF2087 domain-containing protein [Azospirillum formosense]MBY3755118.1 DUF2087 domain-containing protein [Azospirillum formosense]NUB17985.1 DUF2087 domain-containing protein [Azospirillum formosense]